MLEGWDKTDEIYLSITGLLIWLVANRKNPVLFDCALLLLVWYIMASATYQKGEIETEATIFISLIYILLCVFYVCFYSAHWLPIYMALSGVLMLVWSIIYTGPDAYTYKVVKNLIYCGELLAHGGASTWSFYWYWNNEKGIR